MIPSDKTDISVSQDKIYELKHGCSAYIIIFSRKLILFGFEQEFSELDFFNFLFLKIIN